MLQIIKHFIEDDMEVIEYTKDGKTVSHIVKTPVQTELIEPPAPQPTIEEQILFETQYQTAVLEILSLGGM